MGLYPALWRLVTLLVAVPLSQGVMKEALTENGYRLEHGAGYLMVAPRTVRPQQVYRVLVSMHNLYHSELQVRAILSVDDSQYASSSTYYTQPATKMLELDVPEYVGDGVHTLTVEGLVSGVAGMGVPVFRNDTNLTFDSKHISVFIQTDKPVYMQEQDVNFRILAVHPGTLKPAFGALTIYVLDPAGNVVRRWLNEQLNMGMYSNSFFNLYPLPQGYWTIQVEAFGHKYEKQYKTEIFYARRFEVNVTIPDYIFDTEWGLAGTLYSEFMSGKATEGNATIKVEVREMNGEVLPGEIWIKKYKASQATPFEVSMSDMEERWGDLAGKEIFVQAWFYDWFLVETLVGTAVTRVMADGIKVARVGNRFRTFKPATPITLQFAVMRTDGTPYARFHNRQLYIQRTHTALGGEFTDHEVDKLIIPDDGIVHYDITPEEDDSTIEIRAWHSLGKHTVEEVKLFRYYSRNSVYLSVTTSTTNPEVNRYMIFTVRTNIPVDEINYVIVAGGNILLGNTVRMATRQKTFSLALSREMAPSARIVAFFIQEGEVVTDSLTFYVKDTRLNTASLDLNYGKDFSRDTIEFIGRGEPGSYIIFEGLDWIWHRRGLNTLITEKDVYDELSTYDRSSHGPLSHIWYHDDERWDERVLFNSPTTAMDALQTFEISGLGIFSDMFLTDVPVDLDDVCNATLGLSRCANRQCFETKLRCDGTVDCLDGYDEAGCPPEYIPKRRPPDFENIQRQVRFYSDVQWMWQRAYIMPNGRTEIQQEVPESTDAYVLSAFTVHPDEGLAIAADLKAHDCTRSFYMVAEMPANSRRGEQLGIRLTLFNNQDDRIEVVVTLHGSDDYRFVNVEQGGYVSSYSPRTTAGDVQIMVIMEGGSSKYIHFPILPVFEAGELEVTLSAFTFYDRDVETLSLTVDYDGCMNEDHTPYLIDLVNQGSLIIPDFDIQIPEQFWHPEDPWHLYVPGSQFSVSTLFGDVVAPGFFQDYFDLATVIGMPHDHAEGSMFDFAINLQMMNYLMGTNALDRDTEIKALSFVKTILGRQFTWLQDDYSFRMYRREPDSNIWLTSFICRWLHAALDSQWSEELYVDVNIINQVALWITSTQNQTGAFYEIAKNYDRTMQPITVDHEGNEHNWSIALTSEVAITMGLLTRITGEAKIAVDLAKMKASSYLAERMRSVTNPLQMARLAYALQVTNHPSKDDALNILHDMRREGQYVYWSEEEITENGEEIINTVHIMHPRHDYPDLARAVTATSYAMLLYLTKDSQVYAEKTIPMMKWLQTQRMGLMAWSSSQDSLLAIQALTEFALAEPNRFIFQMQVDVENTFSQGWKVTNGMNASNFAHLFEDEVPIAHGQVKAQAQGTGYAMLQVDSGYRVERDFLQANPDYEAFEINIANITYSGKNFSNMDMTVCVRWLLNDITPATGMTWVSIDIPTGYVLARDTFYYMYDSGIPGLRRVSFRESQVILMLDYVRHDRPTCFDFRVSRWYPVANVSIQYQISVSEYAEQGNQFNTLYTSYTLHNCHICMVCGSFQCPYCPFYNGADSISVRRSYLPFAATIILGFLITLYNVRLKCKSDVDSIS